MAAASASVTTYMPEQVASLPISDKRSGLFCFRRQQRLSDWPDCRLELHCCRGQSVFPVRLLMRDHGDRTFAEVLAELRCRQCRKPPAPVYLCAGPREHTMGARRSIELVPTPI